MRSVADRLGQKAMARWSRLTSSRTSEAASDQAEVRVPAAGSTTGGCNKATNRSPQGDPSSVTSVTGRPHSSDASRPGSPMVAEQNTNVGSAP
jgi:hypothetical protein